MRTAQVLLCSAFVAAACQPSPSADGPAAPSGGAAPSATAAPGAATVPAAQPAPATPAAVAMKQQSGPRIDPKATELFKKMSDYLGGLKTFSFLASFRDEKVMPTGEKLEYESSSKVTLRRPNRLHTVRHGVLENLEFFYDGKTMTLFKGPNFYATVDAPANIDGMLDVLLTKYGVDVPGSDLLYADAYSGMMPDVTDAKYLGMEDVGGMQARHISFRGPDLDWQIWVEDGDRPLPLKYVITTKGVAGEPSFGVRLMDWDLAPKASDAVFAFVPPRDAMKIEFKRPADVPAAPQR